MKLNNILLTAICLLFLSGCKSVPVPSEVSTDLSVAELSQLGQFALDDNNYKAAEVYYAIIIDRFGADQGVLTSAEFEIAHIKVKQKRWAEAQPMLEKIILRYGEPGGNLLPPEFLILARNDLAKIPQEDQ